RIYKSHLSAHPALGEVQNREMRFEPLAINLRGLVPVSGVELQDYGRTFESLTLPEVWIERPMQFQTERDLRIQFLRARPVAAVLAAPNARIEFKPNCFQSRDPV